ncbi:LysM peptidoglycan-binding domain-containing protein [Listeria ivanovii subsp. londoniensis]|uniref:LysM peptidoglycan-binding domain-containing protein n=1 Tax=Listeria ivanovii TaxID=1638 RepID=UPI001907C15E|nr:LysM peptidoglycan-binding domain-containing protein [Listeria ivanovii]MBK1994990.1 LysM peptidoglycan-binding domain-containing protein [Listeria ivanovii subsp. londoniensis]
MVFKLGKKSVYQFWINQGKMKTRLPVLPEKLEVSVNGKNDTFDIARLGEVTVIQKPGAKTFTFSAFFPKNFAPYCEFKPSLSSKQYVDRFESWMNSMNPVQFIVTGAGINFTCSIESFNYFEKAGEVGDWYFDITLKLYKKVTIKKIKVKKKEVAKSRPSTKKKTKTYVVRSGDTLWDLSKKFYSKNTDWKKIWIKNKTMLVKRDKRNLRQPGHWIYPGQKLTIP